MEIRARRRCQQRVRTTSVSRMGDGPQSTASDPGAAAFISRHWSPTAGTDAFAARIDATTNRAGARDNNHTRLTAGGAKQRDVSIADYFDFTNVQVLKCLFHA